MSGIDDLPKGNGQVIYINLELLEIDEFDVLYNRADYTIKLLFSLNSFYKKCHDLFEKLAELGYRVIIDEDLIDDDTFCFTPCMPRINDMTQKDYYDYLEGKILLALQKQEIRKPYTVPFLECFSPSYFSVLPIVIKDEERHGGARKILISTDLQLDILKRFYREMELSHEFSNMVIQEYVKTPTEYNTSLRVLVSSCGEIMYASLKYSSPKAMGNDMGESILEQHLLSKNSKYFLGGDSCVSNTLSGGFNILLGEDSYSEEEKRILIAHGIDPNNSLVPEKIRLACQEVMKNCGKELGAICGMDFIYDVKTGEWKYLEEHEFPMLQSYAMKYKLPYDDSCMFLRYEASKIDLIARIHSLKLMMEQKKKCSGKKNIKN